MAPLRLAAVLAFAAIVQNANAAPPAMARRTAVGSADNLPGWSPVPTQAPGLEHLNGDTFDLFKREGVETCGWLNGIKAHPFTCYTGYKCVRNDVHEAFGCCSSSGWRSCPVPTACAASTDLTTACQTSCNFTLTCATESYNECATYYSSFQDLTYTGFECFTAPGLTISLLYPSYYGEGTTTPGPSTSTRTSTSPSTSPSPTVSSISGSSTSPVPTQSQTNAPASKSSTPVGAIAGGVVGGLAVIVLGIIAFFLIKRRSRNSNSATASGGNNPAATTTNNYQSPGPGPGPSPGQGPGYAPMAGGAAAGAGAAAGGAYGYYEQKPELGGAQYPSGYGGAPPANNNYPNYNNYNNEYEPPEMEGNYVHPPAQTYLQPVDPTKPVSSAGTGTMPPASPVSAHSPMSSNAVPSQQTSPKVEGVLPAGGVAGGGGLYRPTSELAGSGGVEMHELHGNSVMPHVTGAA